jgi:hypothetical protein
MDIIKPMALDPPPPRSPSPELLASDDEGAPALVPATLMTLPQDLPKLPPKHTYLRTPVCINTSLKYVLDKPPVILTLQSYMYRSSHQRKQLFHLWIRNSRRRDWYRNHCSICLLQRMIAQVRRKENYLVILLIGRRRHTLGSAGS